MSRYLMPMVLWMLACRDARTDRQVAPNGDDAVPSSAVSDVVSAIPLRDRFSARPPATDHLRYEQAIERLVGYEASDPSNPLAWQINDTLSELERLPSNHRLGALRAIAYRSALSYLSTASDFLAYRRVALTHPWLPASLPAGSDGRWDFDHAPQVDDDELIRRADQLERELGGILETYRPHITPYMECTEHFEDRVLVIRTRLANARGDLTVNTGTLHQLLRAHGLPSRGLTDWDQGITVFRGGECPPPP